ICGSSSATSYLLRSICDDLSRWSRNKREALVGRKALRLRRSQLLAHHVRPQHHSDHLVRRVAAAHPFAAHAAVGTDDDVLRRDVLEGPAYEVGHLLRPLDLQVVMVDDADADLLALDVLADRLEIHAAGAARFERDYVRVDPVHHLERGRVALHLGEHALLRGIAPARVTPDLGFLAQAFDGVVEHLQHELGVDDVVHQPAQGHQVYLRLLHLDDRAAGVGKRVQLRVECVGERHDAFAQALVVLVADGERQQLGRDRAELDGLPGEPLRRLPELHVLQLAAPDWTDDARKYLGFDIVVQYVAPRKGGAAAAAWQRHEI